MIFQPMSEYVPIPDELGIERRDVTFKNNEDQQLHGWFLPAIGEVKGTILFLHGNAENISTHVRAVWWLPRRGFNVFLFDYRGFGQSEGKPSIRGVHADISAALDTLFSMKGVDKQRVVVYGQSLGGALAITSMASSPYLGKVRAVIVEGAFSSYRLAAREALSGFWLTWLFQWPLSFTISDEYRPIDAIPYLSPTPVLIVRGEWDNVIEAHHAEDLFNAARKPKNLWTVTKAGHNNAFMARQPREELVEYLLSVLK